MVDDYALKALASHLRSLVVGYPIEVFSLLNTYIKIFRAVDPNYSILLIKISVKKITEPV